LTGRLFRCDLATDAHERIYDGDNVPGFTLESNGSLLLFMERGRVAQWEDEDMTAVIKEVAEIWESRFNDVIADAEACVFCGTQPVNNDHAYLFRLGIDSDLTMLLDDVQLSNGLGFSPLLEHLYFCETASGTIH